MQEAELMYLLFDLVTDNLEEVVSFLKWQKTVEVTNLLEWENFQSAINRAVESCNTQGINVDDHFREVTKMIRLANLSFSITYT